MKALYMLLGTLLLMAVFAVFSYLFSHQQLVSMQKKIDSSLVQIEDLQNQTEQKNLDHKSDVNKIKVARLQYNYLVKKYNASIKRFPGSYIAEQNDLQPRTFLPVKAPGKQP